MSDPPKLGLVGSRPNPDVVRRLEILLAKAKAGKISSFVLFATGFDTNGVPSAIELMAGPTSIAGTILAFECWKLQTLSEHMTLQQEEPPNDGEDGAG